MRVDGIHVPNLEDVVQVPSSQPDGGKQPTSELNQQAVSVQISDESRSIQQSVRSVSETSSDVGVDRLQQIAQQVRDGQFQVDFESSAEAIIDGALVAVPRS